jgi:hypothetical protein
MPTRAQRKPGNGTSRGLLKLATPANPTDAGEAGKVRLHRQRLPRLRVYLYTVEGTLHQVLQTFHVVCCHGSDARALIVQRLPAIDKLKVSRGKQVDYIAIGDHLFYQSNEKIMNGQKPVRAASCITRTGALAHEGRAEQVARRVRGARA